VLQLRDLSLELACLLALALLYSCLMRAFTFGPLDLVLLEALLVGAVTAATEKHGNQQATEECRASTSQVGGEYRVATRQCDLGEDHGASGWLCSLSG
jgi:hypothetical protein